MESLDSKPVPIQTKADASKSIQDSIDKFLKKGGKIEKQTPQAEPKARKRSKSAASKSAASKIAASNSGINMSCWAGYKVQIGTRIEFEKKGYTPKKKVHAEVADLGSMQMKIFVDDKEVKVPRPYSVGNGLSFGLVTTEAYIRVFLCGDKKLKAKIESGEHINKSTQCLKVSACQGWDALKVKHGNGMESIHDRFKRIQLNR